MTTSASWARTTCGATCPSGASMSAWIRADSLFETFARVCAARAAGCGATVSLPSGWSSPATEWLRELTAAWTAPTLHSSRKPTRSWRTGSVRGRDRPRPLRGPRARAGGQCSGRRPSPASTLRVRPSSWHGRVELLWYRAGAEHQHRLPPLRQPDSPWQKVPLHSTDDASRLTVLLIAHISSNMLALRALSGGRLAALGATRDFRHGLLSVREAERRTAVS